MVKIAYRGVVKNGTDFIPPRHDSNSLAFYVTVTVGNQKKRTKVVKNTFSPVWNDVLSLYVVHYEINLKHPPTEVGFTVSHRERHLIKSGSIMLGEFSIGLNSKVLSGKSRVEEWHQFNGSAGSSILVSISTTRSSKLMSSLSKKKSASYRDVTLFDLVANNNYDELSIRLMNATPEEVNQQEQRTGNTVLHACCLDCKNLDERILDALLDYPKINVHVTNTDENTPLHFFCAKWELPSLEPLDKMLELGAQVNYANSNAETAIFKAISNVSIRSLLMEKLIQHGARMDLLNAFGESVLHYAVRFDREDLVNLILQNCPIVDIKGKEGKTPLEVAEEYKRNGIVKHLRKVRDLFDWMEKYNVSEFKGLFLKNDIFVNQVREITPLMLGRMGVPRASVPKIMSAVNLSKEASAQYGASTDEPELDVSHNDSLKNELLALSSGGEANFLEGKDLEFLKLLGHGTSGDVYKGLYLGKQVAIKVLREIGSGQESHDEFIKEYKIMCAVKHENLVAFYGVSLMPKLCMVMEFCSRGSLYHVLNDSSIDVSWDQNFEFMLETVRGVLALHSNNPQILHRDLKSLNLLITDNWHVKVADFGLSRFDSPEALSTLREIRGTLAYTAPECFQGAKYTVKNDIYSVGIIFWELINRFIKGRYEQPYSEYKFNFDFQILLQAAKKNKRPTIHSNVPAPIADIIRRCIDKNNDDRPDSTQLLQMIDDARSVYNQNREQWDKLYKSALAPS